MFRRLLLGVLLFSVSLDFGKTRHREHYQQHGPIYLDKDGQKWADKMLRKMSPEEKVGQLIMIFAKAQSMNDRDPNWLELKDAIQKYHVGGMVLTVPASGPVLYKTQPLVAAELLNRLQSNSYLPLIFAADFERGAAMRLNGVTVFPHAMAFGAAGKLENAELFGRITAEEARAIGVQWNFFPDADVNSNPANPIINTRSFGENADQVGDYVAAYIRGAHAGGMLTTAKHFPGHGDTAADSHLGLAQVTGNRAHLDAVELPPFRRAIEAGVDAIMVAHVTVPALDPEPHKIATTSSAVVNDLLRKEMGFKGVIVTDALGMGGLTHLYSKGIGHASVDAFKAGSDMLIVPPDLDGSYRAMLNAVRTGEISRARLDESVRKVLELKASLGLHKARMVDLRQLSSEVARPEHLEAGERIAEEAITLVLDNGRVLPLEAAGTSEVAGAYHPIAAAHDRLVTVIVSDDLRTESGHMLEKQVLARMPDARVIYVDPRSARGMTAPVLAAVASATKVVVAVYVIPTAGKTVKMNGSVKNSVALDDSTGKLLNSILESAASRTVVLAMGNPYLVQDFPAIENYVCAFSNVSVSETAAVKAIFGEIPVTGHLPVTIPAVASRGEGIERRVQLSSGGSLHAQP
jgi:beta-N-acetylhexosaminidase